MFILMLIAAAVSPVQIDQVIESGDTAKVERHAPITKRPVLDHRNKPVKSNKQYNNVDELYADLNL